MNENDLGWETMNDVGARDIELWRGMSIDDIADALREFGEYSEPFDRIEERAAAIYEIANQ